MERSPALWTAADRRWTSPSEARMLPSEEPRRQRPSRAWRRGPAGALVPVLLAALAAGTALGADGDREEKSRAALQRALQQIETAFRTADADRLLPVLPPGSKVMVGLESFEQPRAYYAPDQVVLLLGKIFREVRVMGFRLQRDRLDPSDSELVFLPATWSVRSDSEGLKDCRLQFTIRREGERYYIRGIKEVHRP